jgi:hypothetical protein
MFHKKLLFVLLMVAVASKPSRAQDLSGQAEELARKIVMAAGTGETAEFTLRNLSSLTAAEAAEVGRVLEAQLGQLGVQLAQGPQATTKIDLTLSESLRSYVWVAEIRNREKRSVVMTTPQRGQLSGTSDSAASLVVEKMLLIEREEAILDAVHFEGGLLVLEEGGVSFYESKEGRWRLRQSLPVKSARPLPRDLRGRLGVDGRSFQAYLPGVFCTGMVQPAFSMVCQQADVQWPLDVGKGDFADGKNFFLKKGLPPFFSVAGVQRQGQSLLILAALDGQSRLYNESLKPLGTLGEWGSDIAPVESRCGTGKQVIVTSPSGSHEQDAVQAFEIVNEQAIPASSRVELPGPVTALWPEPGGGRITAVVRHLDTGRYAAFSLTATCGH